jgi:hypothetical protein
VRNNVFCLDSHRRKKTELPATTNTPPEATPSTNQGISIGYSTWWKDIRLNAEPSLTVRVTAVNVLTDFRIHPVNRKISQPQVRIALRFDLLGSEQLKQVDFTERSTKLISRLLGREVYVLQQGDTLIYTTTHPSPR